MNGAVDGCRAFDGVGHVAAHGTGCRLEDFGGVDAVPSSSESAVRPLLPMEARPAFRLEVTPRRGGASGA